ncbi:hypothetical protein FSP39_015040 [Pinctada imbricata]|uniref:Amine oxidase n=1 Tax=Pinctada imbricata TaxID=66713 RepID=A0AA89C3L2_PINIB|nr:hypothetical protein FSP39_015040 [Pinctada imbricata]
MERRGVLFPEKPVSPPRQVEPEGKRYSVKYQEVKYMNWKFNFRLSPGLGPRLHNIRYLDRMIVYELALQDIVVFYSGAEPPHQYANFFDSSYLIGMNLQGMVPGVDCPYRTVFCRPRLYQRDTSCQSLYTKENENKYGFRLNHKLIGNLHHHLFNFKVDVDINGQCNRYETLDIVLDKTSHPVSKKPYDVWYQNKIKHHLRKTELDALFKYDFDQPMHHIFYNNKVKSPEGNNMAYRLVNRGMSKSLLPECTGNEGTGAWMRHQITVTKRKETELTSSSIYSALGTKEPVVNFKNFYADNENIVDEDLVAWVTMGTYHIPHTEDLPVTHTPGLDLSFFLSPFNYFPEDPGMGSRDSVRIEALDKYNLKRGIRIDKQTFPEKMTCKAPIGNYFEYILKRPSVIFDIH